MYNSYRDFVNLYNPKFTVGAFFATLVMTLLGMGSGAIAGLVLYMTIHYFVYVGERNESLGLVKVPHGSKTIRT